MKQLIAMWRTDTALATGSTSPLESILGVKGAGEPPPLRPMDLRYDEWSLNDLGKRMPYTAEISRVAIPLASFS